LIEDVLSVSVKRYIKITKIKIILYKYVLKQNNKLFDL